MTAPGSDGARTGLLIHSDRAGLFADRIQALFPAVKLTVCDSYSSLADAIAVHRPDIVLSHKFENAPYPGRVLADAPSVRWIHCGGTGVDHFVPWEAGRVTITNSPGVASKVMSEYALGAIYALNLHLPRFMRLQQRREWTRGSVRQTEGGTVAVIGLGRIGRAICARARAAGLRVIGVRAREGEVEEADETMTVDRLHEALGLADHVIVIVPLLESTRGMMDAAAFARIKPGAFLVNLSRGGVVEETALLEALRSGRIGGAALDVFEQEPLPADSPFWDFDNVLVTPHSAGFVEGWESAVGDMFCDNLERWLEGRPLVNAVAPGRAEEG